MVAVELAIDEAPSVIELDDIDHKICATKPGLKFLDAGQITNVFARILGTFSGVLAGANARII